MDIIGEELEFLPRPYHLKLSLRELGRLTEVIELPNNDTEMEAEEERTATTMRVSAKEVSYAPTGKRPNI